MASETNEVREANRRKSPTPLRQTDGRQIKLETDKLGDTWRETHDEREVKTQKKTSGELDTTRHTGRQIYKEKQGKRDIQRAGHHKHRREKKGDQ